MDDLFLYLDSSVSLSLSLSLPLSPLSPVSTRTLRDVEVLKLPVEVKVWIVLRLQVGGTKKASVVVQSSSRTNGDNFIVTTSY